MLKELHVFGDGEKQFSLLRSWVASGSTMFEILSPDAWDK